MHDLYAELESTLSSSGPPAAIDQLIEALRDQGEHGALFYALLLKARHSLGVSPIPSQPAAELPVEHHAAYEEAIRTASRTVGSLLLERGDIPTAWNYFRLIGDPQPVRDALEKLVLAEDTEVQPLIEIAFQENVYPEKGFDMVLDRSGLCSAITLVGNYESAMGADLKVHCVKRLVRALDQQLRDRLCIMIGLREQTPGDDVPLDTLMAGRDWLFADDAYHIDPSHLGAVVQLSVHLPRGDELEMARILCRYGVKLPADLRYPGEPPFEDRYADMGVYLQALAGDDVDAALAHFRAKAESADPERGTTQAEVLVNLLLRCDRPTEALAAARKYLMAADERQLSCPGPMELARRLADFAALADLARQRGDAVQFLAGLVAAKTKEPAAQASA